VTGYHQPARDSGEKNAGFLIYFLSVVKKIIFSFFQADIGVDMTRCRVFKAVFRPYPVGKEKIY